MTNFYVTYHCGSKEVRDRFYSDIKARLAKNPVLKMAASVMIISSLLTTIPQYSSGNSGKAVKHRKYTPPSPISL